MRQRAALTGILLAGVNNRPVFDTARDRPQNPLKTSCARTPFLIPRSAFPISFPAFPVLLRRDRFLIIAILGNRLLNLQAEPDAERVENALSPFRGDALVLVVLVTRYLLNRHPKGIG